VNYYFQQGYSRENEIKGLIVKNPQNLAVTKDAPEDSRRHQKASDRRGDLDTTRWG
jgi:hypothetical protein